MGKSFKKKLLYQITYESQNQVTHSMDD